MNNILSFMIRRSLTAVLVVFTVSVLSFAILQWIPGNPAEIILGVNASANDLQNLQVQLGLNHPWYIQYGAWIAKAIHANLGTSLVFNQPVAELILERLPVTLSLTGLALLVTVLLGGMIGLLSALRPGGWTDHSLRVLVQVMIGLPSFWIAIMLLFVFGLKLNWFPVGGFPGYGAGVLPALQSLVLPAISLGLVEAAVLARLVRRSMLDAQHAPYMVTALAKGLPFRHRYLRHGLRSAMVPPVTLLGLQVASLLGGAVVVENIFALPGLGRLMLVAVQQKDYPLLEGTTIFVATIVVLVSLCTDLLYVILDPRIRLR